MKTTDERVFVAGVMSEIRKLAPVDMSWRIFARWAFPALALSLGSFALSLQYTIQESGSPSETMLLSESDPEEIDDWILGEEVDA